MAHQVIVLLFIIPQNSDDFQAMRTPPLSAPLAEVTIVCAFKHCSLVAMCIFSDNLYK